MSSGGEPEPAEPKPDTAEPAAAILEAEPVAFEQPAAALDPAAAFASLPEQLPLLLFSVLAAVVLAYLILFRRRGGARGARKVVFFGPIKAGKTATVHRLRFGRVVPTYSSMESTTAVVKVPTGAGDATRDVTVVDTAGAGQLRHELLREASGASGLVLLLDGTKLADHAKVAADQLFDIYSKEKAQRRPPPLLVAVNHSDKAGAVPPATARKSVETEVDRVRLARTTMADHGETALKPRGIADKSKGAFSFDHLGATVTYAHSSVRRRPRRPRTPPPSPPPPPRRPLYSHPSPLHTLARAGDDARLRGHPLLPPWTLASAPSRVGTRSRVRRT